METKICSKCGAVMELKKTTTGEKLFFCSNSYKRNWEIAIEYQRKKLHIKKPELPHDDFINLEFENIKTWIIKTYPNCRFDDQLNLFTRCCYCENH